MYLAISEHVLLAVTVEPPGKLPSGRVPVVDLAVAVVVPRLPVQHVVKVPVFGAEIRFMIILASNFDLFWL